MNEESQSRSRPLVLVADDDADTRELVALRLEQAGCEIVQAIDGEDAERIARERSPDLAVLDVMMPGIDGYQVTKRLRADGELREMPVILLTAKARQEDAFAGFEVGAAEYLTKPFNGQELASRVRELLRSR